VCSTAEYLELPISVQWYRMGLLIFKDEIPTRATTSCLYFGCEKRMMKHGQSFQYEDLVHLIPACLELSMYVKDALSSRSSSASQFAFAFRLSGSL
jgi:hypothetical protein